MYAFGIYDGEEIWHIRLDDVASQPFIENQTLYFTSGEKVYAYASPPPHATEPEMVFVGCTTKFPFYVFPTSCPSPSHPQSLRFIGGYSY
jgi:hypothetical protein